MTRQFKPVSSVYEDLEELARWIEHQKYLASHPETYHGLQKMLAYERVVTRLFKIIRKARRLRAAFDFVDFRESGDGSAL